MFFKANSFLVVIFCASAKTLLGVPVTDDSSLNSALEANDTLIEFSNDITISGLGKNLFPVNSDSDFGSETQVTVINGNNNTLNGSNAFRGFFIRGMTVEINNLTFQNCHGIGGNGGPANQFAFGGGGGGADLGGAVFIESSGRATFVDPHFVNCSVTGDNGGSLVSSSESGGGGGGFGGDGDNGGGGFGSNAKGGQNETTTMDLSGGAGGAGAFATGDDTFVADGGAGGGALGGLGGGGGGLAGAPGLDGGSGGGGGGGGQGFGLEPPSDVDGGIGGIGGDGGFGGGAGGGGNAELIN